MSERTPALVMGIGNLLWADEGFGVRSLEALHQRYQTPAGVELLDGGTQGLYLLNAVANAERLLVFDAIDYGRAPGTLQVVRDEEVPRFHGVRKMSLHQTSFQEVLFLAGAMPERGPTLVTLVGVQLGTLDDFGGPLSPSVAAALEPALAAGLAELASWGFSLTPRAEPAEPLFASALTRQTFEALRPGPDAVCREGDARFLNLRARRLEE
jgi:hydrogenase maturation protease